MAETVWPKPGKTPTNQQKSLMNQFLRSQKDSMPSEYRLLDAFRGAAAIWVVMLHSCLAHIANVDPNLANNPIYAIAIWGQLGVVVFFVISGYCIAGAAYNTIMRRDSVLKFCRKRILRIYPPYIFALYLSLTLGLLIATAQYANLLPTSPNVSPVRIAGVVPHVSNLLLVQLPMGYESELTVAWSLCYEVAFYAVLASLLGVTGYLFRWTDVKLAEAIFKLCMFLTIASVCGLAVTPALTCFPFDRWHQFGLGVGVFALGVCNDFRPSRALKGYVMAAFAVVFVYICFRANRHWIIGHPSDAAQSLVSFLFALSLLLLERHDKQISSKKIVKALMDVGVCSYSIYLVHFLSIFLVDSSMRRLGFLGPWYMACFLMQVFVGVASGIVFFLVVERRWISKRKPIAQESSEAIE